MEERQIREAPGTGPSTRQRQGKVRPKLKKVDETRLEDIALRPL